ncbi:MAG: hypothetical protein DRQ44_13425 [Gammaproteobacteria bacterium]|nr:MAG: hypothetical protein DRQ44_13425 [Gammaproteobacteria bacterium]
MYDVITCVFNGTDSLIQIGSLLPKVSDAGTNNMGGFTLGSIPAGTGNFSNIEVIEALIYNVAHDAGQIAETVAYLETKKP